MLSRGNVMRRFDRKCDCKANASAQHERSIRLIRCLPKNFVTFTTPKNRSPGLPKLTKAAHSRELKDALKEHLEVTKGQIHRLEEVFSMLDEKPKSRLCTGMKGLLEEGGEIAILRKRRIWDAAHLREAAPKLL